LCRNIGDEKEHTNSNENINEFHNKQRDTYYQSVDGTLVPSPSSITTPHHSFVADEEKMYSMPSLPPFEKKIYDFARKNSTKLLEDNETIIESLQVQVDGDVEEFSKPAISEVKGEN
jgi:hypothetical protein